MAKKKSGIVKAAVGIGAVVVAGKLHTRSIRQLRAVIQRKNRIVQILRSANIMQYVRRRLLK